MKNTEKLLSIRHLKQYFPIKKGVLAGGRSYVRANEDVTLDIYRGETLGLVGESGCGKSTLGRTILQLYRPTAGRVVYYGRSLASFAPAYAEKTLKHAKREVAQYRAQVRALARLEQRCEAARVREAASLHRRLVLLRARAETKRLGLAALLGGFMLFDDPREGAALLLERYLCHVRLCRATEEEKREVLLSRLDEVEKQLQSLRERHRQDEEFTRLEAQRDDEGIDLAGLTPRELRRLRGDVQIVFQDPYSSLNPRMTVERILSEGPVTHRMGRTGTADLRAYVIDMMQRCGLQSYMLHRYPHEFSGGQRQRICIARALAVNPQFVVCDECVSALDVSIQSQILNLLQQLKEQNKLTYLFITHDLSVVRYMADRIGVMYLGDIVELGEAEEIFGDPRHPYTVALLSCMPGLDEQQKERPPLLLKGNIPSPIHPPSGCKFHTRCYMACDICKQKEPPTCEVSPGHIVVCHFPDKKICSPD